jgi:hypothetical protein
MLFCCFLVAFSPDVSGQRIAIIAPDRDRPDLEYVARLGDKFPGPAKILESSQAYEAFRSVAIETPFNMHIDTARTAAAVIGCDYFILVKTGAQRRSSFSKPDYFEAFAVHYLISGRSGELVAWSLKSFEAESQMRANQALDSSVAATAGEIAKRITVTRESELVITPRDALEEVPEPDSPAGIDLKPSVPYRRIKPEYATTAFLYDARATVEIEVDLDVDGKIIATRIVRWAGFGLEESVEKAVHAMIWRPAMRKGKALAMRVLLRYNFKKVDKE